VVEAVVAVATERPRVLTIARFFGALMLIATGAVHLQQYFAVNYRVIPLIGPLFLANFAIGLALGLTLLAPVEQLARWVGALAALGGIVFAAGTIIALEIAEKSTLFGFREHGYRIAIILSIVFEGAAIVGLLAYLLALLGARGLPRRPFYEPTPDARPA
jgi:hypothetical protein